MWTGYLLTDIEDSTAHWERAPKRMAAAIARHDRLVDELVAAHGGVILNRSGDGAFAAFHVGNPLDCAVALQVALQSADWSDVGGLWVRIGVHASPADREEGGAIDQVAVNRTARIMACGWGGQTLASAEAIEAFGAPEAAGLTDYGLCRLRGVDDPLRLYGLTHPDLVRSDFPPLRSLPARNDTIPVPAGPLFGREREMADVLALLGEGGRIVTIMGPGGNGKTRLATELAARQSDMRAVYFVGLGSVSNATQLVSEIGATMRFPFQTRAAPDDQLIDYLRDRSILLVLDNADAIVGQAALLEGIVAKCPSVAVLTTSRGALGLAGESTYRLPGLSVSQPGPDDVLASAAFQYFAHEARSVDPTFQLNVSHAPTLREICRIVSGSPLAIHLIASWTRLLALEEMLERLRRGLAFLDAHAGAQADGRQTLRGVFETSWALLSPDIQLAMMRIAVFVGDFSPDAAEAVALVDADMLGLIERRGLVIQSAPRRFQLHPILREFSREKASADRDEVYASCRRHAEYFLDKVRAGVAGLPAADPGRTLEQLQVHVANLRAAWVFTLERDDRKRIARVIEPLFYLMIMRSLFQEAAEVFRIPTSDPDLEAYREALLANCLIHLGDMAPAEALSSRVAGLSSPYPLARAHALHALGALEHTRGSFAAARDLYKQGLDIRRRGDDLIGCSYSMTSLAALHFQHGHTADAREQLKEVYRLNRRTGNATGMMSAAVLGGDIAMREDRLADAKRSYAESLRLEEQVHNPQYRVWALLRLGTVQTRLDDLEGAAVYVQEALDLATDLGDRRMRLLSMMELGANARLRGKAERSKELVVDSLRQAIGIGAEPLARQGLLQLARAEVVLGNRDAARKIAGFLSGTELGNLQQDYALLLSELELNAPPDSLDQPLSQFVEGILEDAEFGVLGL